MSMYKLREDRADVIVPALLIYINVMRWVDCEEIYVPKIGLADGLIHHLYEEADEVLTILSLFLIFVFTRPAITILYSFKLIYHECK